MGLKEKFWASVDKSAGEAGCWIWTGSKVPRDGRGRFWTGKKTEQAPRVSLFLAGVNIPPGHYACHHCDNPPCVNPAHLFVGTAFDNNHDAKAKGKLYQPKAYCSRGHEMTDANRIRDPRGGTKCRECQNISQRKYDAKRRANGTKHKTRRKSNAAIAAREGK